MFPEIIPKELMFNNVYFKGSSGGGGGSSGVVGFPAYMETIHSDWLDKTTVDSLTLSVTAAMEAAHGGSPWAAAVAYDPDADITAYEAAVAGFDAMLAGITETTEWAALYTQAVASIDGIVEAEITADVVAFAAQLDDQITTVALPRFQAGMRNINAVVSSAYVIGEAIIEGFRDRDVAKHSSMIRLNSVNDRGRQYLEATNQLLGFLMQKYAWEETYAKMEIEARRIKIVAKKEESQENLKIDESDATWDLEVFQYGANLLGSIGGGVLNPAGPKEPSTAQSMIGGALSGAAAGAMIGGMKGSIGGPAGAALGAVLGAASGLL
uniref:Uncharacterized protein n=1 Tax=viral metagenome TaxID=1070528 RepID=A0A6M3IL21_9ZZZZ